MKSKGWERGAEIALPAVGINVILFFLSSVVLNATGAAQTLYYYTLFISGTAVLPFPGIVAFLLALFAMVLFGKMVELGMKALVAVSVLVYLTYVVLNLVAATVGASTAPLNLALLGATVLGTLPAFAGALVGGYVARRAFR